MRSTGEGKDVHDGRQLAAITTLVLTSGAPNAPGPAFCVG